MCRRCPAALPPPRRSPRRRAARADRRRPSSSAQEGAIERQRLHATLGRRRVALVHVACDVVEQQRAGKGRRLAHSTSTRRTCPVAIAAAAASAAAPRTHRQHLTIRLQHDRKRPEALGHLLQVVRLEPLLPQRRARRPAPREQQRPGSVLGNRAANIGLMATRSSSRSSRSPGGTAIRSVGGTASESGSRMAIRRLTTSPRRRCRVARTCAPRPPAPTARAPALRTVTARRCANRPARRGSARSRSCGRRAPRRWPAPGRRDSW